MMSTNAQPARTDATTMHIATTRKAATNVNAKTVLREMADDVKTLTSAPTVPISAVKMRIAIIQ